MFNFLPQILIILALAAIIIIIARKLPKTAKVAEVKEKEKETTVFQKEVKGIARIVRILKFLGRRFRDFTVFIFKRLFFQFTKLKKVKEQKPVEVETVSRIVQKKPEITHITNEEKILDLLEQAAKFFGSGNFKKAEEMYIEIIKLDPKNIRAYKGLGKMYKKQGNLKDAKASFEQVLQIKPGDSEEREELKKF